MSKTIWTLQTAAVELNVSQTTIWVWMRELGMTKGDHVLHGNVFRRVILSVFDMDKLREHQKVVKARRGRRKRNATIL